MNYYVSTNRGSDRNPGTENHPWRTLARVNAHHYKTGDRILLRAGERFPGYLHLSPDNVTQTTSGRLEIGAYGFGIDRQNIPPRPLIDAGTESAITVKNLSRVFISELQIVGSGYNTNNGFGVCILNDTPGAKRLPYISIFDVIVSGFRWAGIYVGGIPNDLPGFYAPATCQYGFADVSISDCTAHGNMYFGIYVSGPLRPDQADYANSNVHISGCAAYQNPGDRFYTANHSGSGIFLDNCATGSISRCKAYANGAENAGLTGGPCGIWTHASDRITISHCESYENRTGGAADGTGFDLDGGVTNSLIEYCHSHNNDGAGYLIWNYENAPFTIAGNIIRDCISENDGRKHAYGSVHIGTSGAPIYDILVQNCQLIQSPSPTGTPVCIRVLGNTNENIVFRGNLLTADPTVPEVLIDEQCSGVTIRP